MDAQGPTVAAEASRLTGAQVGALRDALTSAFPRYGALEQMVRVRLDTPLPEIVSENANLRDAALTLIAWAEKEGRVHALLWGASQENPDNPELGAFVAAWRAAAPTAPPSRPPVPVESIQPPGGRYDPSWYVARPELEEWVESHLRTGVPVVLQGPRYMGRSWLLARALDRLRESSPETALCEVNLGRLDGKEFGRLARQLASKLVPRSKEVTARIDDIWSDEYATVEDRTSQVVEELVLTDRTAPFVLVYDVPDPFLQGPCWGPFIQLHRTWMQELSPRWRPLRLAFSWSSHPNALGYDTTSQLNREVLVIGDFTDDEVADLAARHGVAWDAGVAARVKALCGGHPFMVRQALLELACGGDLDAVEHDARRDGGVFKTPVLQDLADALRASPAMLAVVRAVADATGAPVEGSAARRLEGAGVLRRDGDAWALRYGVFRVLPSLVGGA